MLMYRAEWKLYLKAYLQKFNFLLCSFFYKSLENLYFFLYLQGFILDYSSIKWNIMLIISLH